MRAEGGPITIDGMEGGPSRCYPWNEAAEKKILILDPGHGGADPGAVARDGTREADLNLEYAKAIGADLGARSREIEIVYTHLGSGASLADRVKMSNDLGADLFFSIHCNAAENTEANGFEAFTSRGQTGADLVASAVYKFVKEELPNQFRPRVDWSDGDPDREANFYVLKHTKARAVLVELGFLTNDSDRALLRDGGVRGRWTTAVNRAILLTI